MDFKRKRGFWGLVAVVGLVAGLFGPITAEAQVGYNPAIVNRDIENSSDFDGDGLSDLATFEPSTGVFVTRSSQTGQFSTIDLGGIGPSGVQPRVPVPGDYNGDGRADLAFFNRQTGQWATNLASGREVRLGRTGDIPIPGIYGFYCDREVYGRCVIKVNLGQRCTDRAVYDPVSGRTLIKNCVYGDEIPFTIGGPGFIPAVGDKDCDGLTDQGFYNAATNEWRFIYSTDYYDIQRPWWRAGSVSPHSFHFGGRGELPMMGDHDNDRCGDPTTYSSHPDTMTGFRTTYRGRLDVPYYPFSLALPGDVGLMLDVGGGAGYDFSVYRPTQNLFYLFTNPNPVSFLIPFPDQNGNVTPPTITEGYIVPTDFFGPLQNLYGDDYIQLLMFNSSGSKEFQPPLPTERPPSRFAQAISARRYNSGTAVLGDYRGASRSDLTMVRGMKGLNFMFGRSDDNTTFSYFFGFPTDTVMNADYDGDGRFQPGVVRNVGGALYWYVRQRDGSAREVQLGLAGDEPNAADVDGDGIYDMIVTRKIAGGLTHFIRRSATGDVVAIQFGLQDDKTFFADYNGDDRADIIVQRPGSYEWFVRSVNGGQIAVVQWGLPGDIALQPADFDGDFRADVVVARRQGRTMTGFIRLSDGQVRTVYMEPTTDRDMPFVGYFTGTGRAEIALYRPGEKGKSNVLRVYQFGHAPKFIQLGTGADKLIMPNGRAVGPTEIYDDGDDRDTAMCDEILSIPDGSGRGNLWKPVADGGAPAGRWVMLSLPEYYFVANKIEIIDRNGRVYDRGTVASVGLGFRSIVRGRNLARNFPKPSFVRYSLSSGFSRCYHLPDPKKRYD